MALAEQAPPRSLVVSLACPERRFPSVGARIRRRCGSSARSATSTASSREGCPMRGRWLDHGRWGVRQPLGDAEAAPPTGDAYAFLPAEGAAAAPDPGRPGARRHHRARPLPLHRQRRDRRAPGGAARLRAQGHRRPDGRRAARAGGAGSPAASPATARSPMRIAFARAVEAALGIEAPPRARLAARADGRAGAPRQPLRRHRRHLQRRLVLADARPLRHPARARAARRRRLLRPSADDGPRRARAASPPTSPSEGVASAAHARSRTIRRRFPELVELYDNTASLQDRTVATGILSAELARQYGAGGFVGRASGRAFDARRTPGYAPYDDAALRGAGAAGGRRRCARLGAHRRGRADAWR